MILLSFEEICANAKCLSSTILFLRHSDSVALNIGLRLSFGTRTLLHRVHLFLGLNFSSRVKIASLTNKIIHNDMVDEMLRSRTTTLHAETNVVEWH